MSREAAKKVNSSTHMYDLAISPWELYRIRNHKFNELIFENKNQEHNELKNVYLNHEGKNMRKMKPYTNYSVKKNNLTNVQVWQQDDKQYCSECSKKFVTKLVIYSRIMDLCQTALNIVLHAGVSSGWWDNPSLVLLSDMRNWEMNLRLNFTLRQKECIIRSISLPAWKGLN